MSRRIMLLALALAAAPACKKPEPGESGAVKAGQGPAELAPVAVETAASAEEPMPEYLLVTGTLLPNQESRVAAGVAGKVLSTKVERGSAVKKGQVLAELDTRTVAANMAEAQAMAQTARTQREQAKADCERTKKMFAQGAMSQAEFDRSQTQCLATQSQAEAAEARARALSVTFGDADIRAPFAGYVSERSVSAGEYVQAATTIATIVDVDPLRLELSVPESAVSAMREGLAVDFRLAADEAKHFTGTIRYVGPSVRRQSRDLIVEALVPNGDRALVPGMFATARVHTGDPKRVTVPLRAVRTEGSLHYVFVVVGGRAEQRIAQLGAEKDGRVAVLDGLKPGEQVALDPAQLVDGQPVKAR